ncbi:MAG: hypothetical protein CMO55_12060 [Verrucomicrobiales bacterium]|nr:hypothetical protein [Verrucomicrobiales bacterium]
MTTRLFSLTIGILVASFTLTVSTRADDFYIWAEETGGDVVFQFQGSFDVSGLTLSFQSSYAAPNFVQPNPNEFSVAPAGSYPAADYYNDAVPEMLSYGSGSRTTTPIATGDFLLIATATLGSGFNRLVLPPDYATGQVLSGSMTFSGETFASLGVDPTPFTYQLTDGNTTIHMFEMPPIVEEEDDELELTGPARADLLIGKTASKLRGNNIYNRRRASNRQTIVNRNRIFKTNTSKAHLEMQNDGGAAGNFKLRSIGDRLPRMKVIARSQGRNVSGAIQRGRFKATMAPGESVRVVYRLRTNRYFAGVLRNGDRDDTIRFRLTGDGGRDNAEMINRYTGPTGPAPGEE